MCVRAGVCMHENMSVSTCACCEYARMCVMCQYVCAHVGGACTPECVCWKKQSESFRNTTLTTGDKP